MPTTKPWTRRHLLRATAAGVTASLTLACSPSDNEAAFEPLFNGQDLTGWEGDPLLWTAENGMIVGRSPGIGYNDFLATTERFSNFVLRARFLLVDGKGNSGIQYRSERIVGGMGISGYQADIGEPWWGQLYDESRREETLANVEAAIQKRLTKPSDWNDYEIHAEGTHVIQRLNGEVTVDYEETDASIPQDGVIALQIHQGEPMEVRFKDIRIRKL